MFKNVVLFLVSVFLGIVLVTMGYVFFYHQPVTALNPFIPPTKFSLENAPSDSLRGNIASFSGNVSWQSRTANFATLISKPMGIQQGEEINTENNGMATIIFSSVTRISMFPDTQINLIQTLPANFVVQQRQGLATYDKKGNTALSVRALDLLTNIESGTSTISVDKNSSTIIISINSGSVTVSYTDLQNQSNVITINTGKQYIFNNNTKQGIIESL